MPSAVLEVVVGLVFVFFLFSMLSSGINELISRRTGKRADFLTVGLWRLLEHAGEKAEDRGKYFNAFWEHPLVRQLGPPAPAPPGRQAQPAGSGGGTKANGWRKSWTGFCGWLRDRLTTKQMETAMRALPKEPREVEKGRLRPSYIPAETFATVVMSFVQDEKNTDLPKPVKAGEASRPPVPEGSTLAAALEAFLVEAGDDVQLVRSRLERWYDSQMERVSGWYKRESKRMLLWLAALVVLLLNVDTIAITRTLWRDPSARRVVAAIADQQVATATTTATGGRRPAPQNPELVCPGDSPGPTATTVAGSGGEETAVERALDCARSLPLPIGWRVPHDCGPDADDRCPVVDSIRAGLRDTGYVGSLVKLVGWALTLGALTFGAPFWFDLLNRFGSLRGAGAKPKATGES